MQDLQARLEQDDLCCLTGNVRRGRYGNADVRGMQRRRVIDSVSEVTHHVAAQLEGMDDPVFLHGRDPREHNRLFGKMLECRVTGVFELLAEDDRWILKANLLAK